MPKVVVNELVVVVEINLVCITIFRSIVQAGLTKGTQAKEKVSLIVTTTRNR